MATKASSRNSTRLPSRLEKKRPLRNFVTSMLLFIMLISALAYGSYYAQKVTRESTNVSLNTTTEASNLQPKETMQYVSPAPSASVTNSPSPFLSHTIQWVSFKNVAYNFSMKYPKNWQIDDYSITSYDLTKVNNQGSKPPYFKCDFTQHITDGTNTPSVRIVNERVIRDDNPKITKLRVEYLNPSLTTGDIRFVVQDNVHQPISLLCYAYDATYDALFRQMLSTVIFY